MTDQNNVAGFEPAVLETEDLDLVAGGEGGGIAGSGHRAGGATDSETERGGVMYGSGN